VLFIVKLFDIICIYYIYYDAP